MLRCSSSCREDEDGAASVARETSASPTSVDRIAPLLRSHGPASPAVDPAQLRPPAPRVGPLLPTKASARPSLLLCRPGAPLLTQPTFFPEPGQSPWVRPPQRLLFFIAIWARQIRPESRFFSPNVFFLFNQCTAYLQNCPYVKLLITFEPCIQIKHVIYVRCSEFYLLS